MQPDHGAYLDYLRTSYILLILMNSFDFACYNIHLCVLLYQALPNQHDLRGGSVN